MFSFVKSDTIIVGKCWTMPHNYHKKEKMKSMKHKRIIAALLSASMLLGMMLMVPLVHAEDSVSLSQTASPETMTMPEGNKNVTFTGKEWTGQTIGGGQ